MHKRKAAASEHAEILIPQLLTIPQAAAALNVGKSTVYDLINNDGLPYVLVKGVKRIQVDSLRWWIKQRESSSLYNMPGKDSHHTDMHQRLTDPQEVSRTRKNRASKLKS
jgi:excisionase family DNA binding protein